MEVTVLENAETLIPNPKHKSFSGSNIVIPKGTKLKGEVLVVDGKRKGQDFKYRLFKTNDNKYLYLDKINIKDMKEVKSNAYGDMGKPIIVNTSAGKFFGKVPIGVALIGAGVGYGYCKYKKIDSKNTWKYVVGGALIGYITGRVLQDGKIISVTTGN
jgi:hypothetical protein